jgi:hypothetical protein
MEVNLPWIEYLLKNIQSEYAKNPPEIKVHDITKEDTLYIDEILNNPVGFDAEKLIKDSLTLPLKKYMSANHSVISYADSIEDLEVWFRILRCLASGEPTRIVYFGNPTKRQPPLPGQPIRPIHINGGYTNHCDLRTIVIYRKEDGLRVLIHELLHGLCTDPHIDLPHIEADTEAWAEIIYVGFKARGVKNVWTTLMKKQIQYSLEQANYVYKHHQVSSPMDYGWRYISGRLEVWNSLGLSPHSKKMSKTRKYRTLRLTDPSL